MAYQEPDYKQVSSNMAEAVDCDKMSLFGMLLAEAEIDNAKQQILGCADSLSKARGVANRGVILAEMREAYDALQQARINGQKALNEVRRI